MLIPSIDLIDGKAVQLKQGKTHVLTSDEAPQQLATRFNRFGEVAVIDLDAALGKGDNLALIRELCQLADVRAGGGIRTVERAQELLRAGARQIIVGTAATPDFLAHFKPEQIIVAIDHQNGQVVDHGWTQGTGETVEARAHRLAPFCSGYLCTFVETEGGLTGMDPVAIAALQNSLPATHRLTVAGGVATTEEAAQLVKQGLDVQVGMALYTGKLDPVEVVIQSLDFEKASLVPTIVQDEAGEVLMLAYSNQESLRKALAEGKGVYFSRSRQKLWEKGATSGHHQILLKARMDCDRDTLLFTVRQHNAACHTGTYSCFGTTGRPQFSMPLLFDLLQTRKTSLDNGEPIENSFTVKLLQNREKLLRKWMEEATEVTLATTLNQGKRNLVWEMADALYFLSVLAIDQGITWQDIERELAGR